MGAFLSVTGWVLFGAALGAALVHGIAVLAAHRRQTAVSQARFFSLLAQHHFYPTPLEDIMISERDFPFRVRADLQRALDRLFDSETRILDFFSVRKERSHGEVTLADCFVTGIYDPPISVPPKFEDIDVGDEQPVRCLKSGLWFLERGSDRFVVLLSESGRHRCVPAIQFQIGTVNSPEGTRIAQDFFECLEESVLKSESYRGKILSLEGSDYSYSGEAFGIKVHKLRTVEREQVILPKQTLDLLERNVIQFVRQRPQLARFCQATKKGILFYGPPGTGKTHTIHYLARALDGHTTLLITAEQVDLLAEYMTLARLLQPSIVVMEDVDLIARDRTNLDPNEEGLLNKLLNEMDGLKEEADILFILTTNRPETLERALASRPGRIDQAIEFPVPDEAGREKLVRLYSHSLELSTDLVQTIVRRTENVSAAFVKELMRRSVQFHLERNGTGTIQLEDVEGALDEMLFAGGRLNLKLLGVQSDEGTD
jgi:hypothetical protein